MANTFLTIDMILRKCLQVLHAKLNFIGSINRNYDSEFAQTGAKIGDTLRIRLPESYTVTTGRTMDVQDSVEKNTTLTVATQKHVAIAFTAADMALKLDDLTKNKIVPAMSVLASHVEADALTMVKDVYNCSSAVAAAGADDLADYLDARKLLNRYLAPLDQERMALIDSGTSAGLVNNFKALAEASNQIAAQYREGYLGRVAGFNFAENELLPAITLGTRVGSITIDGAAPTGATVNMKSFTNATDTIKKGEIFTIAGYYAVHPETKTPYDHLQQFVVTEDAQCTSNAITGLKIAPEIVTSGAYQNVYGTPGTDAVVTFKGAASATLGQNICYHKDAFAFVSADLPTDMGSGQCVRKEMDGISMRYWRDGDIVNDMSRGRIDVLYGFKTIRADLAVRVWK